MPVEDRRRAQLRAAATTSLGEEAADTRMEPVTPAGHEVASRADIQGIVTAMDAMDNRLTRQLAAMDERWSERSEAMDAKWSERFAAMDARLDHMDERWSERLAAMDERWSERSEAMEQRLTATFERGLREAITSQTRALVGSLLVSVVAIAGLAFGLAG